MNSKELYFTATVYISTTFFVHAVCIRVCSVCYKMDVYVTVLYYIYPNLSLLFTVLRARIQYFYWENTLRALRFLQQRWRRFVFWDLILFQLVNHYCCFEAVSYLSIFPSSNLKKTSSSLKVQPCWTSYTGR